VTPHAGSPRYRALAWLVFLISAVATVPTLGDFGLTWDEPAYRYSQLVSADWWRRLIAARTWAEVSALLDSQALLYYWPYGRFGINFHPPLAGQANLLTYELFGTWMKDVPARRLATALQFSLATALLAGFLSRRYGPTAGMVAAASLLTMPRVYADAHLATTDTPGLLVWAATALAFWSGLNEPGRARTRWLVGILLGLAFLVKMAAVAVLLPLAGWTLATRVPSLLHRGTRADWLDGLLTLGAIGVPLAVAGYEVLRLAALWPPPAQADLFFAPPDSSIPGAILAAPALLWLGRRGLARWRPASPLWGVERPALETWAAIAAWAPLVGWLGNPAWWRETLPRLAHYYTLNANREGALPDIRIAYFGEIYLYSLPWHNAWILIAYTVPVSILLAAAIGLVYGIRLIQSDRLPIYFFVHMITLPVLRMLPTPAHDGVRLLLPTFFFLAAFAGWGVAWLGSGVARILKTRRAPSNILLAILVVAPAALELIRIHPYELSYYNSLIGGPRGAWQRGFELSYWYDAYTPETVRSINAQLNGTTLTPPNRYSESLMTFAELQALGELDPTIRLDPGAGRGFPGKWLLTHDSKSDGFTRLLFALRPAFERRPGQLGGLRVLAIADSVAVSRAWALQLLVDRPERPPRPARGSAPDWVRDKAPWLGRFWGEGLVRVERAGLNDEAFSWARADPASLRQAARTLAETPVDSLETALSTDAARLRDLLTASFGPRALRTLLQNRPEALVEAVEILIRRPDALRKILSRSGYTDPESIGGDLDRDL
jgi:4-amino-4-deoxy-L-arabinose transferase-like glycosyltransferase